MTRSSPTRLPPAILLMAQTASPAQTVLVVDGLAGAADVAVAVEEVLVASRAS